MFSILARSGARRSVAHSVRFMSQVPPSTTRNPGQTSSGQAKDSSEPVSEASKSSESAQPTLDTQSNTIASLDFSPEQEGPQRTGAKSSKGSLSSNEKKRRTMSRVSMVLLALGLGVHTVSMGREWEEDELKAMKTVSNLKLTIRFVLT